MRISDWSSDVVSSVLRFAAIAEARRLDGRDLEPTAELVDDERGQRLAFDVLGDNEKRPARLNHLLQQRNEGLQVGQLLLVDENIGVLELDLELLGVGHEIGREIAAIELHALRSEEHTSELQSLMRISYAVFC